MAGGRKVEEQVTALQELRTEPQEVQLKQLRAALGHRNNYIVAKAADLVAELQHFSLGGEVATAYERFFRDAAKTDPQCWAKNALVKCLLTLDAGSADLFLRGLRFRQMEPVWGGQSDTAITLRSNCALALPLCTDVPDDRLLKWLVDAIGENQSEVEAPVRKAICEGIARTGSVAATLLLRLKAVSRKDSPEVLGACYAGVLSLEESEGIDFVAGFLDPEESGAEAAFALSATRSLRAFEKLKEGFFATTDRWFREVLLTAMALTRLEEALDFLLEVIQEESLSSEAAVKALADASPSVEWIRKLEAAVSENPHLRRILKDLGNS